MRETRSGRVQTICVSMLCALALGACGTTIVREPIIVPVVEPDNIVFEDDFSSYLPAWTQVRGKWAVENGRMRQLRDDARESNSLMYVDGFDFSDVEVSTMVETYGGTSSVSGAGVVFRLRDAKNYYTFRMAGQGVVLGKMVNNTWTDLANPRAADFRTDGRLNSEEELRVTIVGNRIECWIGADSVINVTDDTFATGKVGLVTFKATGSFDDFRAVAPSHF